MSTVATQVFPDGARARGWACSRSATGLSFIAAAMYGAALWGSAPIWAGKKEPWDTAFGPYLAALTLGGLWGAVSPRRPWAAPAGLVVGQVTWQVCTGAGSLWPLAMILLSILAVPAAGVSTVIWLIDRKRHARRGGEGPSVRAHAQ